jgi:hypothetical protein
VSLGRAPRAVGVGLLALAAFGWLWLSADRTFELRDEGYLLARSARTAAGELPHRDFEEVYGPGVCLTTAAVLRAARGEILGVRTALAALKAGAVAATYLAARSLLPLPFALFAAAVALGYWGRPVWMVNTPYAALYTLCLSQVALALWLRADERSSTRGRLAAGLVAGSSVLFKQTLGAMLAGGMLLAAFALALLERPAASGRRARGMLALWAGAALVPPLAAGAYLGPRDYLLHFLPLHALMAAVALGVLRRGGGGSAGDVARRVLPFAAGCAAPVLLAAAFYGAAGGLRELAEGMLVLPRRLQGYASPVALPPPGVAAFGAALLGVAGGGLLALAGRRRSALALVCAAAPLFLVAALALGGRPGAGAALLFADAAFGEVQLALVGALAVAVAWPLVVRGAPEVRALLPVLFFHLMLCFQIFPRAGWNAWLVLPAGATATAWLAWRAQRLAAPAQAGPLRRGLAALLATAVPAWLVVPVASLTLRDPWAGPPRPLALPHAAGIAVPENAAAPVAALEGLVDHLRRSIAADAPLLLLSNDFMIPFLSDRRDLLPDTQLRRFLLGWGMLPAGRDSGIDEQELIRRLEGAPAAVVIDRRGDDSAARIRGGLPALAARIDQRFRETARFGPFRVLERSAAP